MDVRRTSQGLEIIPNCPTPTCRFCGEENHYGTCAEMRAEQQHNDPLRGRPVPIVRSGPMTQTTDLEQRLRAVESSGLPSMEKGVTTCWYRNPDGPEAADEFARLRAENEALREALKPFAEAAEDLDESTPDRCSMWEHHVSIDVEAGDFRRAATAIRSGDAG